MVDQIDLSQNALQLIRSLSFDRHSMIATCRAILSGNFGQDVYDSNLLDVFQLICDDSNEIELTGFGEFNTIYKMPDKMESEHQQLEIQKIFEFYLPQFESSLVDFRKYYSL